MDSYKQPPRKDEIMIKRGFWTKPAVKIGFAFVIGIFAGFMIFSFLVAGFKEDQDAASEMKGTLYNSGSYDNMKTADVLQYEGPVAKAICNVRYSSRIVEVRVELSSAAPVKMSIDFEYNNFTLLNTQNVSVNDQSSAMAAGNFIQINNVGDNKFIFQLLNKNSLPHNIGFTIYQNDSPIFQNSVQVNKE